MPGADFLWLVLQHVLPKGLRRARNFGFLHPTARARLGCCRCCTCAHHGRWVRQWPRGPGRCGAAAAAGR